MFLMRFTTTMHICIVSTIVVLNSIIVLAKKCSMEIGRLLHLQIHATLVDPSTSTPIHPPATPLLYQTHSITHTHTKSIYPTSQRSSHHLDCIIDKETKTTRHDKHTRSNSILYHSFPVNSSTLSFRFFL